MRDIEETPEKYTWRYQMRAIGRDIITISATVSILSGVFWFVANPYVKPYLDLPAQIAQMQIRLGDVKQPRIVEFDGIGLIATEKRSVKRGSRIVILYNLRRRASCETDIEVGFINADSGIRIVTGRQRAVQAPVSEGYASFLVSLEIPERLPPGRYSYQPRMIPIDCGVYHPYLGTMSAIFNVE